MTPIFSWRQTTALPESSRARPLLNAEERLQSDSLATEKFQT
jgi:hypothetical protein